MFLTPLSLARGFFRAAFVFCVPLIVLASEPKGEIIPLKILVNTSDKGEFFVFLDETKKDVLITENDFLLLGINLVAKTIRIDGDRYLSLLSLQPKLTYTLDEDSLSLNLQVMPEYLNKTMLNLAKKYQAPKNALGIDSAFLNYSFIHRGNSTQGFQSLELPLEGVVAAHDWLFQTNFTYHYDILNENYAQVYWARGLTNITRDYPSRLDRLIIGDFTAQSNELGGSGIFLGLSFRKKYSMANYFTRYPGLSIDGLLQTPSKVNMYVNDVLMRSEQLPAGAFQISNLPNLYGAGTVKLEIIDAFGRKTYRDVPYYISTKLLRVGLQDYSYNLGFQRDSLNVTQPTYAVNPSFLGFHRWGLKRYLTAGYRFEISDKVSNAGVNANLLLGTLGELEAGFSMSRFQAKDAYAGFFRYGFTSQYFHGRYAYKTTQENYYTISALNTLSDAQQNTAIINTYKIKQIQSIGVGVHGLKVGSLAINFTETEYYQQQNTQSWSVVYSLRIAKRSSFLFRGVRTVNDEGFYDAIFASINTTLGKRSSANVSHSKQQTSQTNSLYFQRSTPIGVGVGYRLRLNQQTDELNDQDYLADGSIQGKMKFLNVTLDYYQGQSSDSFQSNIAGSLAFIDNDYFLTRPIFDSFALVKVDQLDDVRVYFGNEVIDKTNSGKLIIPDLTSYAANRVSIEALDIPIDHSLKETQKTVSPKYRTGSVVPFTVDRFQGFSGNVFLSDNGKQSSADFADLILKKDGQVFETVVGRKGEFYFENLKPGVYEADLKLTGRLCQFTIDVPASNEMMVELGKYVCQR